MAEIQNTTVVVLTLDGDEAWDLYDVLADLLGAVPVSKERIVSLWRNIGEPLRDVLYGEDD